MKFKQWFWKFFFPEVKEITIARSALDDLCEMAQHAHPKEMLAFFASSHGNRKGHLHIDEIQLQAYAASNDSAHVFLSNLPMTTSIIGSVHSHPGGSVRPSEADLHLFTKLGLVHAIIGEPYQLQNIQFYDRNGDRIQIRIL